MTTLTNQANVPPTAEASYCTDCGEKMNTPAAPCTPAHCQYEGVEYLLNVTFSDNEVRVTVEDYFSPSCHSEAIIAVATELLAERGIDVDALDGVSIVHLGTCRNGTLEMFEFPEDL